MWRSGSHEKRGGLLVVGSKLRGLGRNVLEGVYWSLDRYRLERSQGDFIVLVTFLSERVIITAAPPAGSGLDQSSEPSPVRDMPNSA